MATTETSLDTVCRYVGGYMHTFAHMESALNYAIGQGLGLSALQNAIVCANISLRDKISILKVLTNLMHAEPEAVPFIAVLNTISNRAAADRNMVAHTYFSPTHDGQVDFYKISARNKFDFPETVWSERTFLLKQAELLRISETLEKLGESLSWRRIQSELSRPKRETGELNPLAALFHQTPDIPDADPESANPQTRE